MPAPRAPEAGQMVAECVAEIQKNNGKTRKPEHTKTGKEHKRYKDSTYIAESNPPVAKPNVSSP